MWIQEIRKWGQTAPPTKRSRDIGVILARCQVSHWNCIVEHQIQLQLNG